VPAGRRERLAVRVQTALGVARNRLILERDATLP
jgi:hypothetical protein